MDLPSMFVLPRAPSIGAGPLRRRPLASMSSCHTRASASFFDLSASTIFDLALIAFVSEIEKSVRVGATRS